MTSNDKPDIVKVAEWVTGKTGWQAYSSKIHDDQGVRAFYDHGDNAECGYDWFSLSNPEDCLAAWKKLEMEGITIRYCLTKEDWFWQDEPPYIHAGFDTAEQAITAAILRIVEDE